MGVKQEIVRVRIDTSTTISGVDDAYSAQLQDAFDAQTQSGTLDWKLAHIIEGNTSGRSVDYYLIFEEETP